MQQCHHPFPFIENICLVMIDDSLGDKREDNQSCSVLYCVDVHKHD